MQLQSLWQRGKTLHFNDGQRKIDLPKCWCGKLLFLANIKTLPDWWTPIIQVASAAAASSPRRETAARPAQTRSEARSKIRAETGSQARSKVWSKTRGVPWPVCFSGVGFTSGWRSDSFTMQQGSGKKETHLEQEHGYDERAPDIRLLLQNKPFQSEWIWLKELHGTCKVLSRYVGHDERHPGRDEHGQLELHDRIGARGRPRWAGWGHQQLGY